MVGLSQLGNTMLFMWWKKESKQELDNFESSASTWKVAFALLLISVILGGIAIAMVWRTSQRPSSAATELDIFRLVFSWPVLGFALVAAALIVFQRDILHIIHTRLTKVNFPGVGLELSQPEPPPSERPILGEVVTTNLEPITDAARTDATEERLHSLEMQMKDQQIQQWRSEANHWWHRYLTAFLSPSTIKILQILARGGRILRFLGGGVVVMDMDTGDQVEANYDELANAIEALETYELIQRQDDRDRFNVTDKGREFLRFLNSADGRRLLEELNESRPHRVRSATMSRQQRDLIGQTQDRLNLLAKAVADGDREQIAHVTHGLQGMRNIIGPAPMTASQRQQMRDLALKIETLDESDGSQMKVIADDLRDLSTLGQY